MILDALIWWGILVGTLAVALGFLAGLGGIFIWLEERVGIKKALILPLGFFALCLLAAAISAVARGKLPHLM